MVSKELLFSYCEKDDWINLEKSLKDIEDINEQDEKTGWTLLSVSAFHHSLECVRILLDHKANINSVNKKGTSILMYAKTKVFSNRNFDFLDYLLSKGADISIRDKFGKNILDYVIEKGDMEMINFFQKRIKN